LTDGCEVADRISESDIIGLNALLGLASAGKGGSNLSTYRPQKVWREKTSSGNKKAKKKAWAKELVELDLSRQ